VIKRWLFKLLRDSWGLPTSREYSIFSKEPTGDDLISFWFDELWDFYPPAPTNLREQFLEQEWELLENFHDILSKNEPVLDRRLTVSEIHKNDKWASVISAAKNVALVLILRE
jgi:hypothetical protein